MPTRRRNRKRQPTRKPVSRRVKITFGIISAVILLFFVAVWIFSSRAITVGTYSVVYTGSEGNALVSVYDFEAGEITTIDIPAETYLASAYGFGDWRVASLPKLGNQEGYGGELLRLSLVKSLHFPIDAWAEGRELLVTNSSLSFQEKAQLKLFELRTPSQNWSEIQLADTGYLRKSSIPDGEDGYLVARELPPEVGTVFTIPLTSGLLRVGIYDHTDVGGNTIKNLSEVVHILGGDWAVIEKQSEDIDCIVRGKNELIVKRISDVLVCEIGRGAVEGNFDIEITVGNIFKERF